MFNIFKSKNYIEFNNSNYMWGPGHLSVVIDGKLKEHISISDECEKRGETYLDPYDLIDELKEKYGITKVTEIGDYSQR